MHYYHIYKIDFAASHLGLCFLREKFRRLAGHRHAFTLEASIYNYIDYL